MAVLAIGMAATGAGAGFGYASFGLSLAALFASQMFGGDMKSEYAEGIGPRLEAQKAQSSAYGAMQPVLFGAQRIAGNIIWSTDITEGQEEVVVGTVDAKGAPPTITGTRFFYKASFAVAFGTVPTFRKSTNTSNQESQEESEEISYTERGEYSGIRRMWANGNVIYDVRTSLDEPIGSELVFTVYLGGDEQDADPTIQAIEGEDKTPAYRGTCYIVLENFELTKFGNVLPSITAEVYERLSRIEVEEGVEGMALHPDGSVWICCHTKRTVARVNPDDFSVIAQVGRTGYEDEYLGGLKAHPWRVAVSPVDNSVWVVNLCDAAITKIDPATNTVTAEYPVGYYPQDIAVDATGNIWITYPFSNKVEKRDPSGNLLLSLTTMTDSPFSILRHSSGDIFVGANKNIYRLNPSTGAIIATIPIDSFFVWSMTETFNDNYIWATVNGGDKLVIINTTNNTVNRYRSTGTYPIGCSSNPNDPRNTVYVATFAGNRIIAYSKLRKKMIEFGTISFPGVCLALDDGRVLVCNTKYNIVQLAETR